MTDLFMKDPSAILDWVFDWSAWLGAGETITSHTIVAATGIVKDSSTEAAGKVTVWISSGTTGTTYKCACKIATSAGRTDERTIWIQVQDR